MVIYLPGQSIEEGPVLDELTPREIVRELDKYVIGQPDAKRAVELVFDSIARSLKGVKGEGRLQIGTFGTFVTSKRAARMGRNPRTGEAIKIKASKSLRFKPSSQLKKAAGC